MAPGNWAAWATFAVLLGSLVFAYRQVKEASRLREQQTRPFVVVDFDLEWARTLIHFVIENVGKTVATNVSIRFDQTPQAAAAPNVPDLAESNLLKGGIPTLPPGKVFRTFFDSFPQRLEEGLPMTYRVTLTYWDYRGKSKWEEDYVLDLSFYLDLGAIERNGLHEIGKSLKAIEKELGKWRSQSGRGLDVYTTDKGRHNRQIVRAHEPPRS